MLKCSMVKVTRGFNIQISHWNKDNKLITVCGQLLVNFNIYSSGDAYYSIQVTLTPSFKDTSSL